MSKKIFADLGFTEDEAREQAMRAEIAARIGMWIQEHNLKQKDAAKLFKVPQPTISKVVSGNISNLSLAFFVKMLLRADIPFRICRARSADEVEIAIDEPEETRATVYEVMRVTNDVATEQFAIVTPSQVSTDG